MDERTKLLKEFSAYAFAAYDWNLYLDTHPKDAEGIKIFKKNVAKAKELAEKFNREYGPLTADEAGGTDCWNWIADPWPWEN